MSGHRTKPSRDGTRWTQQDDNRLGWYWGTFDTQTIAIRLERTVAAVRKRAEDLGLGGMRRGAESLAALARRTGYDRETIVRAASRAGVTLRRQPRSEHSGKSSARRHFMIAEEETTQILRFLDAAGVVKLPTGWGLRGGVGGRRILPPACVECGTTERPHYGRDRCKLCYHRQKARDARKSSGNEESAGTTSVGGKIRDSIDARDSHPVET